jgi:hypothetical protein
MDTKIIRSLRRRGVAVIISLALACGGLVLLAADVIAEDQAMVLGGLALLSFAVATISFATERDTPDDDDFWSSVGWGKFFVGLVYASIAIMFLLAFLGSPEVSHVARLGVFKVG